MDDGASELRTAPVDGRVGRDGSPDGDLVFTIDCPAYQITSANSAALEVLGVGTLPVSGEQILALDDLLRIRLVVEPLLRRDEEWTGRLGIRPHADGSGLTAGVALRVTCRAMERDDDGKCSLIEVTAANPSAASPLLAGLAYRATHDPLTELPNRALLRDRLELSLARSRRQLRPTVVILIDFDKFKEINDTHGHAFGDAVLVQAASRMRKALRPSDTIARLGGDEFVAVCDEINDQRQAMTIAHRLLGALALGLTGDGPNLDAPLKASLGVAVSTDGKTTVDEILANADVAMYQAKRLGGDQIVEFSPSLDHRPPDPVPIEAGKPAPVVLPEPLPPFELRFDPIIDLRDGQTVSLEAHAHATTTGVPLTESHPDHVDATINCLDRASDMAIDFFGRYGSDAPTIIVRLGRRTLLPVFGHIEHVIGPNLDLPRDGLIIELGDDVSRGLTRAQLGALHDFRRAGVGVSIAGFGSAAVSPGQLAATAAQIVKIDDGLMSELDNEFQGRAVERVSGIVDVAADAEVALIATGVTNAAEVDLLSSLGCLYAQGPLFGIRMRPALVTRFIENPVAALI